MPPSTVVHRRQYPSRPPWTRTIFSCTFTARAVSRHRWVCSEWPSVDMSSPIIRGSDKYMYSLFLSVPFVFSIFCRCRLDYFLFSSKYTHRSNHHLMPTVTMESMCPRGNANSNGCRRSFCIRAKEQLSARLLFLSACHRRHCLLAGCINIDNDERRES